MPAQRKENGMRSSVYRGRGPSYMNSNPGRYHTLATSWMRRKTRKITSMTIFLLISIVELKIWFPCYTSQIRWVLSSLLLSRLDFHSSKPNIYFWLHETLLQQDSTWSPDLFEDSVSPLTSSSSDKEIILLLGFLLCLFFPLKSPKLSSSCISSKDLPLSGREISISLPFV